VPGSRFADANPSRLAIKRQQMHQPPYCLYQNQREVALDALREVCLYRGWRLWAAHVRSNHVHAVVEAEVRPELVMNALKSYASRRLNRLSADERDRNRWLWKDEDVLEAIRYIVSGQGKPMEVYHAELL
jgi:REP element-mobilizing transposase RayT